MKKILLAVTSLFMLAIIGYAQNKTAEQDAIRKVIDLESQYYFEGNYDKWATTWVHESTSYWTYSSPDFNNEVIGWETISAGTKSYMSNPEHLSTEEIAARSKRYDYQYNINGNLAHVIYRQDKGNFQTCTLEKQNGEWKITGSVNINTTGYDFKNSLAGLQAFTGKWKYVDGSYKTENAQPADSNYKVVSADYNIQETQYGIEFVLVLASSYAGKPSTSLATVDFIADKTEKVIKFFYFQKDNDAVSTASETASFDTTGKFIVKGRYEDKSAQTQFENIYSFTPDGLLHYEGRSYDANGKVTFKWLFTLKRDYSSVNK